MNEYQKNLRRHRWLPSVRIDAVTVLRRQAGDFLCVLFLLGCWGMGTRADEKDQPVGTTSPQVIYDQATSDIFPESWRTEPIQAKAELLDESERSRCREWIERAFRRYPKDTLEKNLKKLYMLGALEYSGAKTGGTNSRSNVYLVSKPQFRTADVEKNFHAEFSSILFRNFPMHFEKKIWEEINPSEFRYGKGGVQAVLDKKASTRLNPTTLHEGFLTQYATASLEEDFNSFAGRLFMGDTELWDAQEKHKRIREKLDCVLRFYERIDMQFNRSFFESLRNHQPEDSH